MTQDNIIECTKCGLLRSTVDATHAPCFNPEGTWHDFGDHGISFPQDTPEIKEFDNKGDRLPMPTVESLQKYIDNLIEHVRVNFVAKSTLRKFIEENTKDRLKFGNREQIYFDGYNSALQDLKKLLEE